MGNGVFLCCSFSPRGVLDEILNLTESFSEGFSSYFFQHCPCKHINCGSFATESFRELVLASNTTGDFRNAQSYNGH